MHKIPIQEGVEKKSLVTLADIVPEEICGNDHLKTTESGNGKRLYCNEVTKLNIVYDKLTTNDIK